MLQVLFFDVVSTHLGCLIKVSELDKYITFFFLKKLTLSCIYRYTLKSNVWIVNLIRNLSFFFVCLQRDT